jgi:hypothetical protein
MIRCDSDQTYASLLSLHMFDQNHIYSLVTFLPPFFTYVLSEPHLIIGHIPPSFLYMCLNRTTSNHWSHSSLLSLHMFDQIKHM